MAMQTVHSRRVMKKSLMEGENVVFDKKHKTLVFIKSGDTRTVYRGDTVFDADAEKVLPKYLFYYLQSIQDTALFSELTNS